MITADLGLDFSNTLWRKSTPKLFLLCRRRLFFLTMDGSPDSLAKEQETFYVRTCNKGKITCQFLCVDEPESTTADDPMKFVMQKLKDY